MSDQLVWLITGTSSGLGREIAIQALSRGDKVIATARARSLSSLDDLKSKGAGAVELDVTWSLDRLHEAAAEAMAIYGGIDVLINNAGAYLGSGAMEEQTPEETLDQFNTNLLGPTNVTRAFLPYMRQKRSGTIAWIGSLGGWVAIPNCGLYSATKFAMRAVSESFNQDIGPLGLRSICFDLGYYRTQLLSSNNRSPHHQRIADYKEVGEAVEKTFRERHGNQQGDAAKAVKIMIDVIRGEGVAEGKNIPSVFVIGRDCYDEVQGVCEKMTAHLEEWKDVIRSTDWTGPD